MFTVSSCLCGMAWSPASLIFFAVQGLGAGAIAPTAMAIIFRVFPPQQRGLGMGIYSLGWTFGPILGPTLGVPDGYAELARHFLHQPAPGDHWRGAGGDRHAAPTSAPDGHADSISLAW